MVTKLDEIRLNVCVNKMAPFGPCAAIIKGKILFDSNCSQGGLSRRRDSRPTRYERVPSLRYMDFPEGAISFRTLCGV